MGLDLPGNGSSETMYDEGDGNLAVENREYYSAIMRALSRIPGYAIVHKTWLPSSAPPLGAASTAVCGGRDLLNRRRQPSQCLSRACAPTHHARTNAPHLHICRQNCQRAKNILARHLYILGVSSNDIRTYAEERPHTHGRISLKL